MVKKRNGAIDFWRFVFAVILVIHHSHMIEINLIRPEEETIFPFQVGSLAVEFFLLTSGFLFAKSSSGTRLWARRCLRSIENSDSRVLTM